MELTYEEIKRLEEESRLSFERIASELGLRIINDVGIKNNKKVKGLIIL